MPNSALYPKCPVGGEIASQIQRIAPVLELTASQLMLNLFKIEHLKCTDMRA